MRFNFKNVGEGIGALGDAYNKVQLGRMYDEASKQTMRPAGEGSPEEQARAAEEAAKLQREDFKTFSNIPDTVQYGLSSEQEAMARADQERGNLGANYQMPASTSSAVDRYGLGTKPTELRNTPYTPSERRTVGLEAQADFLARQGRTEEASRLLDTVEARKTGALNQQLLQENVSNAGLRRQGLVQGIEKGGLDIAAGRQGLDLGKLNLTAQQRAATSNEAVDAVSKLMARAEAYPQGSLDRVRLEDEIKSKTAGLPIDVQSSMVSLAKVRADLKRSTEEERYIKATATPEAFVKHYNEELKDGETAQLVRNKNGTTSIVVTKEGGPSKTPYTFKDGEWNKVRNEVLAYSPQFAAAKFTADIAHANKIEQLQLAGAQASARTAMIVKGKEIKMSPETRTELMDMNKKRTDLLSKGEALTPADEKELQKLDIRLESVVNILAIENNQLPALLSSSASKYRTDNPPPRAGAKQSELNPNEWEVARNELIRGIVASQGKSFTDMPKDRQDVYIDNAMNQRYYRKAARPAQGASAGTGVVNADTTGRLKALREKEITDLAAAE